jgi:hypothetical protein
VLRGREATTRLDEQRPPNEDEIDADQHDDEEQRDGNGHVSVKKERLRHVRRLNERLATTQE